MSSSNDFQKNGLDIRKAVLSFASLGAIAALMPHVLAQPLQINSTNGTRTLQSANPSSQKQAQDNKKNTKKQNWGRPKRRTSGGDRNSGVASCQPPLTALIPGQGNVSLVPDTCNSPSWSQASKTEMRSPIVWFYIPDDNDSEQIEFALLKDGRLIHKSEYVINETGGLLPIAFDYELEPNVWYDWQLSIIRNPDHPTEDLTVESSILYQEDLNTLSIQDSLLQTAQSVCMNPDNTVIQKDWNNVLQTVDLLGIISAKWLRCITPNQENS